MKAAFCNLLRACWEGTGVTDRLVFALTVIEFWTFLGDTCCYASFCIILLFHLFFYHAFYCLPLPCASPLHGPLPIQAFLLLELSYGTAFNNLIPFSRTSVFQEQLHWHWWLGLFCLMSLQPLWQLLTVFGKCQKQNPPISVITAGIAEDMQCLVML